MTAGAAYLRRRAEIQTYFDATALEAWKRFASSEPLSRIRATVRQGRDEMRAALLGRLPQDLSGWRVLDAGCGAGAAAFALAQRGAEVAAIDLSPQIVAFAEERAEAMGLAGRIAFRSGDMLAADLGRFDAVVAMDSLIHYRFDDAVAAVAALAERTSGPILFTVAPKTPLLAAMHAVGRVAPRAADKAPRITPMRPKAVARRVAASTGRPTRAVARIARGFYISQAMEAASP